MSGVERKEAITGIARDNFENGIFWKLYKDLERQFQNFIQYVPFLPGNEDTYSFKLLNMILSIGGYVDSALKEMVRFQGFVTNTDCQEIVQRLQRVEAARIVGKKPDGVDFVYSKELFEVFETIYKLSEKEVIYKILTPLEYSKPFEAFLKKQSSGWWNIYNGLKHDVGVNLEQANLQNTLHSLASAFLLNAIHTPSIRRLYDSKILKPCYKVIPHRYTVIIEKLSDISRHRVEEMLDKKQPLLFILETPLFIYDYNQLGDKP